MKGAGLQNVGTVKGLIQQANYLSNNLGDLLYKAEDLMKEGSNVELEIQNSYKFREDQLVEYLVEHLKDEEQLQLLLMNTELKRTVDEYQLGVEKIMAKYREHCEGDMLMDGYYLREKYISNLSNIVKHQDERIDQMVHLMQSCADLSERDSLEHQEIIHHLIGENEQMRCQLQISNNKKMFLQGSRPSNESGTQFNESDASSGLDSSDSISSLESFITCLSFGCDTPSTTSSIVSQIEVSRFIELALADNEVEEVVAELSTAEEEDKLED